MEIFFGMKSKIYVTGSTTPQTSNQIDAAVVFIHFNSASHGMSLS